jgi:glucosamine--fructose-6-phosphate aminotransferase (isomerizing)
MRAEALEAPAAVARLLEAESVRVAAIAADLVHDEPQAVLTLARGSSDHAAHYFAYLAMARLGRLVTSLPMSLLTLYRAPLQSQGLLSIAVSQSGQSPDLVETTRLLAAAGARTLSLVNAEGSPLAAASRWALPLHAGPEQSVAATKSYIAQLVAGAMLVAAWEAAAGPTAHPQRHDTGPRARRDLLDALPRLPAALEAAAALDWTAAALPVLVPASRLYVVSRGTGLAVAMEAALKLKETCGLQAEAFSGAELRHGPMALVEAGYPLLVFAPPGPAQAGLLALAADMRARGAHVLLAAPAGTPGAELPLADAPHDDLAPIATIQSFYGLAEALARARGFDPDRPPFLAKVTRTR